MKFENLETHKLAGRLFGAFFIITFLAYGFGTGLIESSTDNLSLISDNRTELVLGAILMAIIHTIMNIGLPVVLFPILRPHSQMLTYGYLGLAIAATVTLIIGVIFLLLLLPLSEAFISSNGATADYFELTSTLLKQANFFAYQIGMALWGIGGLLFVSILYRAKLVPRFLSIWGIIGYVVFIAGTIFELFGYEYGLMANIPGGLFELLLSFWLIFKGFNVPNKK